MNIAEILKYCNKGTKLYSTIFGDVYFQRVRSNKDLIEVTSDCDVSHEFFPNGSYSLQGECVLFPSKTQRDWSKFRLSIKKGDIMMLENGTRPFIFRKYLKDSTGIEGFISDFYCGITKSNELEIKTTNNPYWTMDFIIPASEEAKKELFDKIAESGYKWNADTLKLEKIENKSKKQKYRPFKNADECWKEMLKHQPFGWVKKIHGNCNFLHIMELNPTGIIINNVDNFGSFRNLIKSYDPAFKGITFADGTPFGIKEEE